jgi:hypothetical protein
MIFTYIHTKKRAARYAKRMTLCIAAFLLTMSVWAQAYRTFVQPSDSSSLVIKKKDTMTVAQVWKWSLIAPSFGQFFNRQYWKTPIVLGGIGGLVYGAYTDKTNRSWYILSASAIYWASLLDATVCYRYDKGEHLPSKAAIYATLVPGLGQAYNQKYWKLPLVYAGFLGMGYLIQSRNFRLNLFGKAYRINYDLNEIKTQMAKLDSETQAQEYADLQVAYTNLELQLDPNLKTLSMDALKSYRDKYRRDRDYYIILTCLFYGLTIIDAVVDAHFFTYDMSNDLSFYWSPYVEQWAMNSRNITTGVSFNIRF